jgi:hypothetical protein
VSRYDPTEAEVSAARATLARRMSCDAVAAGLSAPAARSRSDHMNNVYITQDLL